MIGSGEKEVMVENLSKLFCEGGDKLWTMIRDDFITKLKTELDLMKKESSYSLYDDGLLDRAENYPLSKPMVNHDQ